MPASSVHDLSRQWIDRLAPYRRHRNDEQREALVEEAARYAGVRLEHDLSASSYWSKAPLARRVAVLLFLVDRRVVVRSVQDGHVIYSPTFDAESWVSSQPTLVPYLAPTLELIAALRHEQVRRTRPTTHS